MSNDCLNVVLVHGWAGHPDIWTPVCERLTGMLAPTRVEWLRVDHGYYGPETVAQGRFDLAVGHSAGVIWLLNQRGLEFERLVSLSGFTRFCRGDRFDHGWPPRIVDRMNRQLQDSPRQVLEDFWMAASTSSAGQRNFPLPAAVADAERLRSGLQALSSNDCREQWDRFSGPRMVIAGTEDGIVSLEHTAACFSNDRIEWIKTDSHWLPWTFPETCAGLLREVIEDG